MSILFSSKLFTFTFRLYCNLQVRTCVEHLLYIADMNKLILVKARLGTQCIRHYPSMSTASSIASVDAWIPGGTLGLSLCST